MGTIATSAGSGSLPISTEHDPRILAALRRFADPATGARPGTRTDFIIEKEPVVLTGGAGCTLTIGAKSHEIFSLDWNGRVTARKLNGSWQADLAKDRAEALLNALTKENLNPVQPQ